MRTRILHRPWRRYSPSLLGIVRRPTTTRSRCPLPHLWHRGGYSRSRKAGPRTPRSISSGLTCPVKLSSIAIGFSLASDIRSARELKVARQTRPSAARPTVTRRQGSTSSVTRCGISPSAKGATVIPRRGTRSEERVLRRFCTAHRERHRSANALLSQASRAVHSRGTASHAFPEVQSTHVGPSRGSTAS